VARDCIAQTCEPRAHDLVDTAQLLVSEVVTNAVRHGRGPVELRTGLTPSHLWVEVEDHGPGRPRQEAPEASEDRGRGLSIVDALASAWGTGPAPSDDGKTVWFELQR
jgi:anti-sigma regulatory factor (Ser/Thr protein kinase)